MLLKTVTAAVAGLALAYTASATEVTIPNVKYRFDSEGNALDAHDGKLYFFDGQYYLYGTANNCGFRWRTSNFTSTWCGFSIYRSPDLETWYNEGFTWDPTPHEWQERCADVAACFRPKVVQNPRTGEYVLWMNEGASKYSYTVFTSDKPTGPFIEKNQPTMPDGRSDTSWGNGDFGLHIGPDGKGYIAYDNTPHVTGPSYWESPNITFGIVIELTDDYYDVTSNMTVTQLTNVEAFDIMYRKGWWYLFFGHICGYCDGTDTSYVKSRSPLGPWRQEDRVYITNSSCGGQHNGITKIPSSKRKGGSSSSSSCSDKFEWMYSSDLWSGDVNEGKAGHHWEPLHFLPDGNIKPLNCEADSYTMHVPASKPGHGGERDVFDRAAASSAKVGGYDFKCDMGIQDNSELWQFFRANKNGTLKEVGVNVAQQANNAGLQVSVSKLDDVNKVFDPLGTKDGVWSGSWDVDEIGWGFPIIKGNMSVTVKEDDYLGIHFASRAGSVPYCYLERDIDEGQFPQSTFMARVEQGRYVPEPIHGKEMRFYAIIE